jgi:hypothetical protein
VRAVCADNPLRNDEAALRASGGQSGYHRTTGTHERALPQSTTLEQAIDRCIGKFAVRFSSALMALDDQVIADHGTETPRRADRHEPSLRMVETAALARNSRRMFALWYWPGFALVSTVNASASLWREADRTGRSPTA